MVNYACDLCGYAADNSAAVIEHLATAHAIHDAGEVGRIEQADGVLRLLSDDGETIIDLGAALSALSFYDDPESIELTTARSSSSYGAPVLVIGGEAFGPGDRTPTGETGAQFVRRWVARFTAATP